MFLIFDSFVQYDSHTDEKKLLNETFYNLTAENKTTDRKPNYMLLTHAYVHWLADVHFAVFAPAFPFVVPRQEIRPQTANAHSLSRYGQQQKMIKSDFVWLKNP